MSATLDEPVTITLTRAQAMLVLEALHVAGQVLDLSKPLGGGHRLRSLHVAFRKIATAVNYPLTRMGR